MVKEINSEADFKEASGTAGANLMVIDFFATWCGPCMAIAPFVQQLSEEFKNVVFIKIDVDNDNLQELVQKFDIKCMPTFVFLKSDKQVDRLEGADEATLKKTVQKNI